MKYHPEDSVKRKEEQKAALVKRVDVFKNFWDTKVFEGTSVDGEQQDKLTKILDMVVILLEGGDENDFKVTGIYFKFFDIFVIKIAL